MSDERDILTWLVGRDAGSLRGHKVHRVRATVSLEIFIRSSRQSARGQTRAQAIYIRPLRCRFQEPERNPLDCLVSSGHLKSEIHTSVVKTNNIKSKFYQKFYRKLYVLKFYEATYIVRRNGIMTLINNNELQVFHYSRFPFFRFLLIIYNKCRKVNILHLILITRALDNMKMACSKKFFT